MKKIIGSLFLLSLQTMLLAQAVTFMSYNIRYDTDRDSLDAWTNRKVFLRNQVQFYQPDIMGTQEGLKHQLDYLQAGLVGYEYKALAEMMGKLKENIPPFFIIKLNLGYWKKGLFGCLQHPILLV